MLGILSIIVFLPVLMAIPTYILGKIKPKLARIVCIGTTTALFGLTMLTLVFYQYGSSTPAFQLVDTMPWAPSFGLNYIVGAHEWFAGQTYADTNRHVSITIESTDPAHGTANGRVQPSRIQSHR